MSQYRTPRETNKYYIPREEFLTLIHYCRQYPSWEAELRVEPNAVAGIDTERERVQTSNQSDSTSALAMRRASISQKKKTVDETVALVSRGMDKWLILGVCYGMTYYQLDQMGIPCGSRMYYRMRQHFFYELSKKV